MAEEPRRRAYFEEAPNALREENEALRRYIATLRESEDRYRSIVENFHGIAFRGRMDFTPVFFQGAVLEITGYTESDFIAGRPRWDEVIHPEDRDRLRESFDSIARQPDLRIAREYRIIRRDGETRWIHEIISSTSDDSGRPAFVEGTIIDITDQKETEAALRRTEHEKETILDAQIALVAYQDREHRVIWANRAACSSVGLSREELIGRRCYEVWAGRNEPCEDCPVALALLTGTMHDCQKQTPDGRCWHISGYPVSDIHGNSIGAIGVTLDVTERRFDEELKTKQLELLIAANEKRTLPDLLKRCLKSAIQLSGLDSGGVYLRDAADQSLNLACHEGLSEQFVALVSRVGYESPKYQVVVQGRPVYQLYDNLGAPADEASRVEGLRAIAVLPLLHRDEVVGCLNVASHTFDEVPRRARIALETIAALAGGIIASSEMERDLVEGEQRLTRIVETSPVGIVIVNRQGEISFANAAAERILGLTRSEILSRTYNAPDWRITDFEGGFFPDDALPFRRVMATGESAHDVRHAIEHPDGRRVLLSINASPLFDEKGSLDGTVASLNDVTSAVNAERAIARRIAIERFATETTTRLLELAALDIERGIDQELERLARFAGVDRAFILEATGATEMFCMTHEWSADGVEPGMSRNQSLRRDEYQLWMAELRSRGFIRISREDDLPREAVSEREAMRRGGVRSLLATPMSHRGNTLGLLGWVTTRSDRVWSDDDVMTIDMAAHAFAGALAIQRADHALRDSETRLSSIFRAAPVGIGLVRDRVLLHVNERICEMVGRSADELVGRNARILYPTQDDYDYVGREKYRQIAEHGTGSVETRWLHGDGTTIDVLLSSTPLDPNDMSRGVTFTAVDITARKQYELALRRESDRIKTYLDIAAVMFVVIDVDGNVSLINRKGCEILGYAAQEIVGKNWFEHFVPERFQEAVRAEFEKLLRGEVEPVEHLENPVVTWGGEERVISWHNTVLRDADGKITATLSSGEDVTDRRRIEEERTRFEIRLRQQQKLESIGTLAAGVAHEINNPINGIMNYAQLIANRLAPDDRLKEYAGRIVEESERVSAIVRDLLAFSRQERQAQSPARVQDIVASTVGLVRALMRKDQIALDIDVPDDLPSIRCRSQQIQQVLLNLLMNASDALDEHYPESDPGKRIRIQARRFEKEGRAWIRMTVEDSGGGIPPEIGERVFDPFFTTKPRDKGTGLGLSVSYGIAKDHQGALWFESEPGRGTRFHLDLPYESGRTLAEQRL